MKKACIFLLNVLLLFTMCACSNSGTTYTVEKDSKTFEVNLEHNTIFDGTHTYEYEFSGDSSSYDINIIYPNGAAFYWSQSGYSGHGGWSDDYDPSLYVDGDTLREVIVEKAPNPSNPGKLIAAIFLFAVGSFNAASPRTAWYLEYGWRYKNAEPSDLALGLNRVGGILAVFAGAVILFLL